jgi:hypothetical protein
MGKSDDAGFFYSPKRMSTHVAGRDFHARPNGVAPLREEYALCPLPSYEGRNRRGSGERFLFNRNSLNRKIRFTPLKMKTLKLLNEEMIKIKQICFMQESTK